MGAIKDQLAAFNTAIDNAWDELSMLDETLYNLGLSYDNYAIFRDDLGHIIDCLNQLSSEVKDKYAFDNRLDSNKLDYSE